MSISLPIADYQTPADIRALFFDIDGTLVDSTGAMPSSLCSKLERLAAAGIAIGLASGRALFAARNIMKQASVNAPSMFFAGSLVVDKDPSNVLMQRELSREDSLELIRLCREADLYLELYSADGYFTSTDHSYREVHEHYVGVKPEVTDLEELASTITIIKANVLTSVAEEEAVVRKLGDETSFNIAPARGARDPEIAFINVNSADCSRKDALQVMCQSLGLEIHQAAAFGDSASDADLLSAAGVGISIGGSESPALPYSDYYCASIENGGTDLALQTLFPKLLL